MSIQDLYINFVNKHYKKILITSLLILVAALGYVLYNYIVYGRIFNLSVEITGGYLIIIPHNVNISALTSMLHKLNVVDYDIYRAGGNVYIEAKNLNTTAFLNYLSSLGISKESVTIQRFSSYVGGIIFNQLITLLLIATVIICIFIWIRFRKKQPVLGIITVILWDLLVTFSLINIFGLRVGPIGLVTLLGILGFAIDNNIVLATNVFQERELSFGDRVKISLKVGLLMELFIVLVVVPLYFLVDLPVVKQFSIIWLFIVIADSYAYLFLNVPIYRYFEEKLKHQ